MRQVLHPMHRDTLCGFSPYEKPRRPLSLRKYPLRRLPHVASCSVYFSLAEDNPEPTAKLITAAKYHSRTDIKIAEGVDMFI